MVKKEKLTISVDKGLVKESQAVLDDCGQKISSYINVVLKALVNSKSKSFKAVVDDMVKGMSKGKIKAK